MDTIGKRLTSPIIMTRPRGWRWAGPYRISRRRKKWLRSVSPVLRLVQWPKKMWADEWDTTHAEVQS